MNKLKKRRKGGFTLIEMVVVIAIVVIIAAIAIPQALKAINKSKASTDIANARTYAGQIMAKIANNEDISTENMTALKSTNGVNITNASGSGGTAIADTASNLIGGPVADTKLVKNGVWNAKLTTSNGSDVIEIYIGTNKVYPTAAKRSVNTGDLLWGDYVTQ